MSAEVLECVPDLSGVRAEEWDALVTADHPFMEHRFLRLLEQSGAVGGRTGWSPLHLLQRSHGPGGPQLTGAMAMYGKTHSQGEYIFDFAWANAAMRAGIRYYPKLVCAAPFTPATGPRLLGAAPDRLLAGVEAAAERVGASSAHVLFLTDAEATAAAARPGWIRRLTWQYHFENQGWPDFESFLASFRSHARKEVRRERRRVAESGLRLQVVEGADLTERQWRALYPLYLDTVDKKGAYAYLPQQFFDGLRDHLAHRVVVSLASDGDEVVGAAIAYRRGRSLYGRNWGATREVPGLHFELCFYQLIDYALERGITHFEAGAQGEHKIRRGFLPAATHSVHWIRHRGLAHAVREAMIEEEAAARAHMEALAAYSPFR